MHYIRASQDTHVCVQMASTIGSRIPPTSAMVAMRSCVSGRRYRKRPAVSSSAAAASTLCPLKSSSSSCDLADEGFQFWLAPGFLSDGSRAMALVWMQAAMLLKMRALPMERARIAAGCSAVRRRSQRVRAEGAVNDSANSYLEAGEHGAEGDEAELGELAEGAHVAQAGLRLPPRRVPPPLQLPELRLQVPLHACKTMIRDSERMFQPKQSWRPVPLCCSLLCCSCRNSPFICRSMPAGRLDNFTEIFNATVRAYHLTDPHAA